MEINIEILSNVASKGSKKVSESLSKLSKEVVEVSSVAAKIASIKMISEEISIDDNKAIISYAQMISGIDGMALLTIPREEALTLVDLLNGSEVGSTGVFMDIDRSAIKETLNILSNSFLTILAEELNADFMIGSPRMVPTTSIKELLEKVSEADNGEAVFFNTSLKISKHQVRAQLYIIFSDKLANLLKEIK
jgi:chemotaxis protein CheY-P-specific phosphatase CheC